MSSSVDIATATKICFVVSPMEPVVRQRIEVIARLACVSAGYRPEFADDQLSDNIREGIVTSLAVAPMVIAYLGRPNPEWNSNVILELGYRMATRKPLVIVCDDVEDLNLPFHIRTDRVIRLPLDDASDADAVEAIAARMKEADKIRRDLLSNQAVALLHAPRDGVTGSDTHYVAASKRASELFGVNGKLVGMTLEQFIEARRADMPDFQFNAFIDEQATLATTVAPGAPVVVARVPMVFRSGPQAGRAFLPIIVNYQQVGEIQEFRVLYLDVTDNCQYVYDSLNDRSCFVARMNPRCRPLKLPELPVDGPRTDRVFLAYNSQDRLCVKAAYDRFCSHKIEPWYDEAELVGGDALFEVIESALESCRVAMIFIGKNDFGRFQKSIELPTLLNLMLNKQLRIIPVLMDGLTEPTSPLLQSFKWVSYDEAVTDDWIRGFHQTLQSKPTKPR